MSSRWENVRVRVFSFGWENWNHKWRTILLLPVFAIVGHAIGFFVGVHLFPASVPDGAVTGLFVGMAMLLGGAFLALID